MRWEVSAAGFSSIEFRYPTHPRLARLADWPIVRDRVSEEVVCLARKPITVGLFPG